MDQRRTWGSGWETAGRDMDLGTILSTLQGMSGESSSGSAALQPVQVKQEQDPIPITTPGASAGEFITLEVNVEPPREESYEYFPPKACLEQQKMPSDNMFYPAGTDSYLSQVYVPLYPTGPPVYLQGDYQPAIDVNSVNPPAVTTRTRHYAATASESSSYLPKTPTPTRRQYGQRESSYVRRPPNAFMIFMRDNRAKITNTLKPKHSVEANTILGRMWKSMTEQEQAKYYELAAVERRRHAEEHPDWSSKDNYGQKRKRQRAKAI